METTSSKQPLMSLDQELHINHALFKQLIKEGIYEGLKEILKDGAVGGMLTGNLPKIKLHPFEGRFCFLERERVEGKNVLDSRYHDGEYLITRQTPLSLQGVKVSAIGQWSGASVQTLSLAGEDRYAVQEAVEDWDLLAQIAQDLEDYANTPKDGQNFNASHYREALTLARRLRIIQHSAGIPVSPVTDVTDSSVTVITD